MTKCNPIVTPFDGEYAMAAPIVEGNAAIAAYAAGTFEVNAVTGSQIQAAALNPCDVQYTSKMPQELVQFPPLALDVVCMWRLSARRHAAGGVLGGQVYISGGYSSAMSLNDDTWRRAPVLPLAAITLFPVPYSHDTLVEFGCNEPACLFEYRILESDGVTEARTWVPTLSPINYVSYLASGDYVFQVRVM
jgi:hypothetical protein